ncbi:hypothetical protein NBRC116597_05410 [Phaeobacter sp. NW0010-22]
MRDRFGQGLTRHCQMIQLHVKVSFAEYPTKQWLKHNGKTKKGSLGHETTVKCHTLYPAQAANAQSVAMSVG